MKKNVYPPVKINRRLSVPLVRQTEEVVRLAIERGVYPEGSALPSRSDLAKMLGVSEKVVRLAMERLAADGLVFARRKVGCVVLSRSGQRTRGHVLFVLPDSGSSYYSHVLYQTVSSELAKCGYLAFSVTAKELSNRERSSLDAFAAITTLAVVLNGRRDTVEELERRDVPYLTIGEHLIGGRRCVGHIRIVRDFGLAAMVDYLRREGVKSVLQIAFAGEEADVDARPFLRSAGIRTKQLRVPAAFRMGNLDAVQRLAYQKVRKWLLQRAKREGRPALFFSDDYLAFGGMGALSEADSPADRGTLAITWYNHGFGPCPWREMPRLEMDPLLDGQKIGEVLRGYLEKRRFVAVDLCSRFREK